MNDNTIYLITALMPLATAMVVLQVNPYHALVIRGILGAVAALVYAILGAADVALTEALVGTMLAITLYGVAVRSSLVMRLGVLKEELQLPESDRPFGKIVDELRLIFRQHYMRVELVPYKDLEELHHALVTKEIHATCIQPLHSLFASPYPTQSNQPKPGETTEPSEPEPLPYYTTTRIKRLHEIMEAELTSSITILNYFNLTESGEKH
ncbi:MULTISPECIES: DUF4040 domain-containing protein [Arthrospira]|jgi:uncharacterized MnhB-related membrane protein|uniref:Na+/H+ antiporter subunit B1 n=2 Tax=Limnospira TaxID=2596745 RepID=C7DUW2_LIMMA|nr:MULTISPECIES: DUF4040 domain-containing protein [Arthrospira]ACT20220.1 Na+/H+ antiporter subunit B1 [Limnospira maxima FACHB-438]AMW30368.1 hypothetical protein AP285_22980 [Arthrospira platensis YZ]KDR55955.1 hypothetical protein APPUASWS_019760 [Arthrospira platensis str. Paraca]MBD2668093.1 DUF4040 domain-containing protein [Arthrospira platensis FACHB-439]MBD2709196.1 DUF4040 domain-containing protein [Arthrospira platensis FACHB-835]MDF2207699.1 DUF4040 domain-containing protein [Art